MLHAEVCPTAQDVLRKDQDPSSSSTLSPAERVLERSCAPVPALGPLHGSISLTASPEGSGQGSFLALPCPGEQPPPSTRAACTELFSASQGDFRVLC